MDLEGYLDGLEERRIHGWIHDRAMPDRRVPINVHFGRDIVASLQADGYRGDLLDAGIGDGRHAFEFRTETPLTPAQLAAISLRIPGSTRLFVPGGQALLRSDLPDVPPAPRRFRRCILHIGTEKTGTTTLQMFLHANRARLATAGVFQPRSLTWPDDHPEAGARALVGYARSDESFDDPPRRAGGVTTGAELRAWRARLTAALAAELAAAPTACDTILFSSEHCHSHLRDIHEVLAVRHLLAPFCEAFEVVVYLRPQHELAASAYGMWLRQGRHDAVMLPDYEQFDPSTALHRHYFDHETLLARWSAAFGRDALRVRLFTPDALRNGDVVDDFTEAVLPAGSWHRPSRSNENQTAAVQHLLIGVGRALAGRSAAEAERVNAWLEPRLATLATGRGIQPTRAAVERFMAQFAEANERVRATWFPTRPTLFAIDLTAFPEAAPPADAPLASACQALVEIILREPTS